MAWSKDDKQWLAVTGGGVIGQERYRENRRQQHRENQSAHVATIGALICAFSALTLLAGQQEGHLAHKNVCFGHGYYELQAEDA